MNKTERETKMGFFKKRSGAILVFCVVVILASFFAANRSLSSRVQEVTDLFYDGTYDPGLGYRKPSIKRQLDIRKDASNSLLSIGLYYPEAESETSALRSARNAFEDGLSRCVGAGKLYVLNKELDAAYNALYVKLGTLALDSARRNILDESRKEWDGSAAMIQKSGYNEAVRQFNRDVLSVFPTNFVMKLALVKPPELFE